jgi:preprotein translocase SecE subunit
VARNRKRAKERRARRPEPVVSARRERSDAAPPPIAHAAPDVELAEAQLALGRDPELESENGALEDADELELEAAPAGRGRAGAGAGQVGAQEVAGGDVAGGDVAGGEAAGGEVAGGEVPAAAVAGAPPERHPNLANRLAAFLEGCWRELQRVQWPDRRQVMQATGVVIGFVIIAGVFLGVADYVAQQIVKFVLK